MAERPESPAAIHFPEDGVRAVDIPVTQINVDARNQLVEFDNGDASRRLSDKLETDESIRSIVMYTDVDLLLKDVYDENVGIQAGWTVLQGLPEIEEFRLDLTVDQTPGGYTLTPEEVPLQMYLFTTDYEQFDPSGKKARTTRANDGFSVDSTSYEPALVVPASPYDESRFKVENIGGADLDARVQTIDGGDALVETEKKQIADSAAFNKLPPADFYVLELKQNGSSSTEADTKFRGESN